MTQCKECGKELVFFVNDTCGVCKHNENVGFCEEENKKEENKKEENKKEENKKEEDIRTKNRIYEENKKFYEEEEDKPLSEVEFLSRILAYEIKIIKIKIEIIKIQNEEIKSLIKKYID